MADRGDDTRLVLAAIEGDADAFGVLFDRWFDRTFDVAFRIVRNRDTAAEVAQEAFLAAWQGLGKLEQPESFGGWLLRTSRNRALNRLDREKRAVALGNEETTMEIDRQQTATLDTQLEQSESAELVWTAAAALGPRDASVLDLHLRHGLGAPEIAEELGVTANNAHQLLFRLKDKLGRAIRAAVLYRNGRPACIELVGALSSAGISSFGADAVSVIGKHADRCDDCAERQQLRLAPDAMFAAVPIIVAGPFLKAQAAAALEGAGVPMGGSASAPRPRTRRAWHKVLLGSAAAVVVALVVGIVLARPAGNGPVAIETAATEVTTTTAAPTATTTATVPPSTSAVPTTTAPPVVTTEPPVDTTPTTTAPPAVPRISSFTASTSSGAPPCQSFERLITLSWSSADATTATIVGPNAPTTAQPASGSTTLCTTFGVKTWQLTVSGPGGSATKSVTA